MLIKKPSASSFLNVDRRRTTFAECICLLHGRPAADFVVLAWRFGARWPTRCLRPLIIHFAPRYFEAEDVHLERAADCYRRSEIAEEMQFMRTSILRRGLWRYLGIGLNGDRLLRHYDSLLESRITAAAPKGSVSAESRSCAAMVVGEQSRT